MKDIRFEMRVKNNILYSAIKNSGYRSVAAFCRANALQQVEVVNLINFRTHPKDRRSGNWRAISMDLERVLSTPCEVLFPLQLYAKLDGEKRSFEIDSFDILKRLSADELLSIEASTPDPEEIAERNDRRKCILSVLGEINPRYAEAMILYFGLDGTNGPRTLEEVGAMLGCPSTTVVQRVNYGRGRFYRLMLARHPDHVSN